MALLENRLDEVRALEGYEGQLQAQQRVRDSLQAMRTRHDENI